MRKVRDAVLEQLRDGGRDEPAYRDPLHAVEFVGDERTWLVLGEGGDRAVIRARSDVRVADCWIEATPDSVIDCREVR